MIGQSFRNLLLKCMKNTRENTKMTPSILAKKTADVKMDIIAGALKSNYSLIASMIEKFTLLF